MFMFMSGSLSVMESDTSVQVCVLMDGLLPTESLGCAVTATVNIQEGFLTSMCTIKYIIIGNYRYDVMIMASI